MSARHAFINTAAWKRPLARRVNRMTRSSILKSLRLNLWLLRNCRDVATWRALKWAERRDRPAGPLARLKLRGLDRAVLYRPASTDRFVVWEVFQRGEYEVVRGGDVWPFRTVVDCGANTGLFLAWVIRAGGREALARYVGVEPGADAFAVLGEQVGALGVGDRATLVEAAVWDRDGSVNFAEQGASWSHHVTPGAGRAVRAVCVGGVLDEAGLERCDLLKLDIEGGEEQVLESLPGWAGRVDAIVAELHGQLDYEWFARTVSQAGFVPVPRGALFRMHPGAVRRGGRFEHLAPAGDAAATPS